MFELAHRINERDGNLPLIESICLTIGFLNKYKVKCIYVLDLSISDDDTTIQ